MRMPAVWLGKVVGRMLRREDDPGLPGEIIDSETGWYRDWYFVHRLSDEVRRARTSGRPVALVFFRLPLDAWASTSRLRLYLDVRLGLLEREVGKDAGFFGRLGEDEFAFCVSSRDPLRARASVMLLENALPALSAEGAVVSFPEDAQDAVGLLEAARRNLDSGSGNIVDLLEYRLRRGGRAA